MSSFSSRRKSRRNRGQSRRGIDALNRIVENDLIRSAERRRVPREDQGRVRRAEGGDAGDVQHDVAAHSARQAADPHAAVRSSRHEVDSRRRQRRRADCQAPAGVRRSAARRSPASTCRTGCWGGPASGSRAIGRRYVAADLSCLPFADESFDGVTCGYVLEHLPDPSRGCASWPA